VDGRYPERAHFCTPRFGYVVPSDLLRAVVSPPQLLAQALQICVLVLRETLDRDMVHAGRAFVGRHFREGRLQRRFGLDLVDQAVPFAAFHPLFEGSQHP